MSRIPTQPQTQTQKEKIKFTGTITRVLYSSPKTAWKISLVHPLATSDNEFPKNVAVKVVGNITPLLIGGTYVFEGSREEDPRYGPQFVLSSALLQADVSNPEQFQQFLAETIGVRKTKKLVEQYGKDLFPLIETKKIPEIDDATCASVVRDWTLISRFAKIVEELTEMSIPQTHHTRILDMWGELAPSTIRADFYSLIAIRGIGFIKADEIALANGVQENAPSRIRAAIDYILEQEENFGHCWSDQSDIFTKVFKLTGVRAIPSEHIDPKKVYQKDILGTPILARTPTYLSEANIHHYLCDRLISQTTESFRANYEKKAETFITNRSLNPAQADFIRSTISHRVVICTGGPGTGKTHSTKVLLDLFPHADLLAPTGKAAKRISELTNFPASTIHSFLGPTGHDLRTFKLNEQNPAPSGTYIIDEASMIDTFLFSSLLAAIPRDSQVIIIGDVDQLPSIGPGSVLFDLIKSKKIPVVRLEEIVRQKEGSKIIQNAHAVNTGSTFIFNGEDFTWVQKSADTDILDTVCERVVADPSIQVLVPVHKHTVGTAGLNTRLQQLLNPSGAHIRSTQFRLNDRVIYTENDYQNRVMNGEMGVLVGYEPERKKIHVCFDSQEGIRELSENCTEKLSLAYAISIHKSQGSEFDRVIIPLHQSHGIMLQRNLLYTAITRAKKHCTLIGSSSVVELAVRRKPLKRRTQLLSFLLSN